MTIKVIVNGANGKMGQETLQALTTAQDLKLIATTGRADNLGEAIKVHQADVVVDFTTPTAVFENAKTIINHHAHPVIGTTGLTNAQIATLEKICKEKSLGAIIAPNFSLGAVLMMKYSQDAAKYFADSEIIELHHPQKLDAPSGTAKKTALMMKQARDPKTKKEIPIHSVRLPGLVAHQLVLFGGLDETLTIRHDSIHRRAFMPGVLLACRKVMKLDHLVYGLENIL